MRPTGRMRWTHGVEFAAPVRPTGMTYLCPRVIPSNSLPGPARAPALHRHLPELASPARLLHADEVPLDRRASPSPRGAGALSRAVRKAAAASSGARAAGEAEAALAEGRSTRCCSRDRAAGAARSGDLAGRDDESRGAAVARRERQDGGPRSGSLGACCTSRAAAAAGSRACSRPPPLRRDCDALRSSSATTSSAISRTSRDPSARPIRDALDRASAPSSCMSCSPALRTSLNSPLAPRSFPPVPPSDLPPRKYRARMRVAAQCLYIRWLLGRFVRMAVSTSPGPRPVAAEASGSVERNDQLQL